MGLFRDVKDEMTPQNPWKKLEWALSLLKNTNGAGQPHTLQPDKVIPMRTSGLYGHDSSLKLRVAQDNEQFAALYKLYLEDTPKGHEAHRLLHTH